MITCPDIDDLLSGADAGPDARAHIDTCGACAAVVALAGFRRVARSPGYASDACAEFEPAIAAMISGNIHRLELGRLAAHLGDCAACSDVASRLTLFRSELDEIPEPVPPEASATPSDRGETTDLRRAPAAGKRNGFGRGARRALGAFEALLPPRSHRLAWAGQLGAVACLAGLIAYALAHEPEPIVASHEAPARPTAAAGGEMARAMERALSAEARVLDTETRLRELERQLEDARRRLAELEPPPKPERKPAPERSSKPDVQDPFAPPTSPKAPSAPTTPTTPSTKLDHGFVTVVCSPFCDEVLIDGVNMGPSPIVHVRAEPGNHRITLKRKRFSTKVLSVVVVSGQVTTQRISMKDRDDGQEARQDGAFDRASATSAIADGVRGCTRAFRTSGRGNVTVTFAETGVVSAASVTPWAGSPLGGCITSTARAVTVPPFSGGPVTVNIPVVIAGDDPGSKQ